MLIFEDVWFSFSMIFKCTLITVFYVYSHDLKSVPFSNDTKISISLKCQCLKCHTKHEYQTLTHVKHIIN